MAATLSYPFEGRPEPATVKEVAPGILWIHMPLPFAPPTAGQVAAPTRVGRAQKSTGRRPNLSETEGVLHQLLGDYSI